jgi:hypothetical protein
MKRRIVNLAFACFMMGTITAQTTEELMAIKEAKAAELTALEAQLTDLTGKVDALKVEIENLTEQVTPYPRWDLGAHGNIGLNISNFSDWLSKEAPNTNAVALTFAGNAFADLDQRKYFWRNKLNLTLGWQKFDDETDPTDDDFETSADAGTISSLFGYKLGEKLAISVLGEYRSTVIENFNNPGYLDIGAGITWTPVKDLYIVVHPFNYNHIFFDGGYEYISSFGAKVFIDYKTQIAKNLAWTSNLSAFVSYEDTDLSNWTWINGLTTKVKGIGIGLDFGLRGNKQEAEAAGLTTNPLQTYWVFGITYGI